MEVLKEKKGVRDDEEQEKNIPTYSEISYQCVLFSFFVCFSLCLVVFHISCISHYVFFSFVPVSLKYMYEMDFLHIVASLSEI